MGVRDVARLDRELDAVLGARPRDPKACADVLERAAFACRTDPAAAERWVEAELLDELVDCYEALGRVDEAITVMRRALQVGWAGEPDGRCRIAELLMRDGRVQQATEIWEQVRADTPDDVWLYNNAGLEYAAIDDHETALTWLTQGLRLAMATGDPEGLVEQLADLRDESLSELGRREDQLQRDAEEFLDNPPPPPGRRHRPPGTAPAAARPATPPTPWPPAGVRGASRRHRTDRAGHTAPADAGPGGVRVVPRHRLPAGVAALAAADPAGPREGRRRPRRLQPGPATHPDPVRRLRFLPAARGRGPGRTVPGLVPTSTSGTRPPPMPGPGTPRNCSAEPTPRWSPGRPAGTSGAGADRAESTSSAADQPPADPTGTTRYSASAPAFGVVRCRARCAAVRHAPPQYLAGRPPRAPSVRNGLPHRRQA